MKKKCIVLLSGGLDSATVLFYAKKKGYHCRSLFFHYGQKHSKELSGAIKIAGLAGSPLQSLNIELPWSKSSLLRPEYPLPKGTERGRKRLPSTYVPGRNTLFLSYALSMAESIKAGNIFIGANSVDFSGYPDCRPQYFSAWNRLLSSLGAKTRIRAPLLRMSKKQIVLLAKKLSVPIEHTWSCYAGGKKPCGTCDSCLLRLRGFKEAGIKDPSV